MAKNPLGKIQKDVPIDMKGLNEFIDFFDFFCQLAQKRGAKIKNCVVINIGGVKNISNWGHAKMPML